MDKMEPCPMTLVGWCKGGEIVVYDGDSRCPAFVRCAGCRAERAGKDRAEAIAAWNTRPQPADRSPVDEVERLREALKPFADAGEYLDLETEGFLGGEKIGIFYNDHELFDGLKFRDFSKAYETLKALSETQP